MWQTIPVGKPEEGCDGSIYQKHEIIPDDAYWALNPYKRPPLEVWKKIQEGRRLETDTSPDRLPISHNFPGRDIRELRGKHVGPVAILCNGRSLQDHDLHQIPCPTIGMNRTYAGRDGYNGPQPDYYCFIDFGWIGRDGVKNIPFIINLSSHPEDIGWRVVKSYRMKPFSFDIWRDGVCPVNTGYASLQVAVYLGFTELYILGMDYGKQQKKFNPDEHLHFDDTPSGQGIGTQPEWLDMAAPVLKEHEIKAYFVGSPQNGSEAFPHVTFEEFLQLAS